MKKSKRRFLSLGLALTILGSTATGIYAASVSFSNIEIPKYQVYSYLDVRAKSGASDSGRATINKMTADGVTFSARALGDDFASGKTAYSTGSFNVPYRAYYPAGKNMQARFRNTNYSGNYNTISGSFDYR